MTKILESKISQLSENYHDWDRIFQDLLDIYFGKIEVTDEHNIEICSKFQKILTSILDIYLQAAKTKDTWELPPKLDFYPFGQGAILTSQKLRHDFSFGFYEDNFYLESYILYPWNLKHMPNDFCTTFTELFSFGKFSFQENAVPTFDRKKPAPDIFKGGKSDIYTLIRNYILLELYSEGSLDLGWFRIEWPHNTSWEVLIRNGCDAFKRIYRLNYMLYRVEYLRRQSRK